MPCPRPLVARRQAEGRTNGSEPKRGRYAARATGLSHFVPGNCARACYTARMSVDGERERILQRFTCGHIRLTRALVASSPHGNAGYHWAPGCVHPKMHSLFDGQQSFCERCACYTRRPDIALRSPGNGPLNTP
jgi:hypothetical protein